MSRQSRSRGQQSRLTVSIIWVAKLTHEDVVCLWTLSSDLEQLHQVEELAMNISTDLSSAQERPSQAHSHWTVNILDVALVHQDLLCLLAQLLH